MGGGEVEQPKVGERDQVPTKIGWPCSVKKYISTLQSWWTEKTPPQKAATSGRFPQTNHKQKVGYKTKHQTRPVTFHTKREKKGAKHGKQAKVKNREPL